MTVTCDHVTPGGVEVAGEEMVSSEAAAGDREGPWGPGAGEWGLTGNGICCVCFLVSGGPCMYLQSVCWIHVLQRPEACHSVSSLAQGLSALSPPQPAHPQPVGPVPGAGSAEQCLHRDPLLRTLMAASPLLHVSSGVSAWGVLLAFSVNPTGLSRVMKGA